MFGTIHVVLKDLVVSSFCEEKWTAVCHKAGLVTPEAEEGALQAISHSDELTISLVTATCSVLGLSLTDALVAFGRHFVTFALRSGHARFLLAQGATLPAFLANVNSLHHHLERDNPEWKFPFLEVEYDPLVDEAQLTYRSQRKGLSSLVVGIVEEIGRSLYGVEVFFQAIEVPDYIAQDEAEEGSAACWRVSWTPRPEGVGHLCERPSTSSLQSTRSTLSFAGFHSAMVEFRTLVSSTARDAFMSSLACSKPQEAKLLPEVAFKLKQVQRSKKLPAEVLLRATSARHVAAGWLDAALQDCRHFWSTSAGRGADYLMSQDAQKVDLFVSHSWTAPDKWAEVMGPEADYADVKSTTLCAVAKDIAAERPLQSWEEVTFWVDKACIPQDNSFLKQTCINLIEEFIGRCEYMCVLFTWGYLQRLWCVYELACVLVLKSPNKIWMQTDLFMNSESLPLYLEAVRRFSIAGARCGVEADRKVLESKIKDNYVSGDAFETLVKATAIALTARCMAHRAGRSRMLYKQFFQPWVTLATDLGFDKLADSLSRGQMIDWRKQATTFAEGACSVLLPSRRSPVLLGRLGFNTRVDTGVFRSLVERWFALEVVPALHEIRSRCLKAGSEI